MGMGDQMSRTSSIIVITIRVQEQVFVTVAQEDFDKQSHIFLWTTFSNIQPNAMNAVVDVVSVDE